MAENIGEDLDVNTAESGEDSSTSMDESGASSSTEADASNAGDIANQSLADFVKEQVKVPGDESDATDKEATGEKPGEEKSADTEKKKEGETEEKEETQSEEKVEEKGPVPYERFEEVNTRVKELDRQVQEVAPALQAYDRINNFCVENAITSEQFEKALRLQALLNSDPEKALQELGPIVNSLQGFVGDKLPSDLQAKVDEGKMELPDAKEMARLRARQQFGEQKTKHDQSRFEAERSRENQRQMMQSLQTWESSKRGSDPDYKPKAGDKMDDGKFELTKDKYLSLLNQIDARGQFVNPVRTPQDIVALMEKAYTWASGMTKRMGIKPATRKTLTSNGSSTNSNKRTIETAKTMAEAMRIAAGDRINGE